MNQVIRNLAWRIGGPQGSGVNRIARLFARACASQGAELICRREYHSNIMGRHSYNDILMGSLPVSSHRESTDVLVTFDAETLCRHAQSVTESGFLLYSDSDADVRLQRLSYLDERLRDDISAKLRLNRLPESTQGLLQMVEQAGVTAIRVPYQSLLSRLGDELGLPKKAVSATLNMLAVAVSAALLKLPQQLLLTAVNTSFANKPDIIQMNHQAVSIAYQYVLAHLEQQDLRVPANGAAGQRLLLNATQSVALGKLAAGMGFQSYYPISPATDESTFLEAHADVRLTTGEAAGPLVLQVEDELAAINMANGAALTGARSATATSGPGLSLMAEGLGWAGMNEVPLVVTLYQRGGPSTGMPTRTDQADLLFALHAGHGEFPRIMLASGDVASCFYDAAQAFDYAERYQMPVIHMLDKALTSTLQTVPVFQTSRLAIERGELAAAPQHDRGIDRFALTASGLSPRPLLGQVDGQHWLTGVEHSEQGQVTEDPVLRESMMEKRAKKLALAAAEIPLSEKLEILGDEDAALTVFTWGSNKGAVVDAMHRLSDKGIRARAVQLRLLWPFPTEAVLGLLDSSKPSVLVECTCSGQLNTLFRQQAGRGCDHQVLKYNGRPISGEALFPVLQAIHAGEAESRIVLRNACE
ncbi:MAG: 2-oxoacid:acceptor oxidoreductase subunit alpha [Gammaproteobacteria bacterium]